MTPDSLDALDAVAASAADLARAAVLEIAPAEHVGQHLEVVTEDELLDIHHLACTSPGYVGWRWAVTLARVPGSDRTTVSEVVLLPGSDAVLAPVWVPWNERVRPGDLSPGDLYPTDPEDPRLEPGYTGADALEASDETASTEAPLRPEQWQLGLGRERVLSSVGRDLATERWWDGDFGPESAMAKAAPGACQSCAFLMPMGGLVGQAFGVCANSFGADGRVVALGYGCGAHSSVRALEGTGIPVSDIVIDEYVLDEVDVRTPGASGTDRAAAERDADDEPAESLDAVVDDDISPETPDARAIDMLTIDLAGVDVEDLADVDDDADLDDDDDGAADDDLVLEDDDNEDEDEDDNEDDDEDDHADDEDDDDEILDIEPDEVLG